MSRLVAALYLGLIPLCAVAAAVALAGALLGRAALLRHLGRWLVGASFLGVFAAWSLRWAEAGHLPLFGTYESGLSLALAVLVAGVVWQAVAAPAVPLGGVAAAVAAVLLAHAARYDPTAYALTISERSWVVDVHAVVAWAAFGVLAVNLGFALFRLSAAQGREVAERGLATTLSLGFLLHTAMMASGSFYKFLLFGTAWSFDPIETLGFVAWMAYGTLLHLHLMAGWQGRRLARWCLGIFVLVLVSYRAIVFFPAWSTYHIFDMDLRIHLTGGEEVDP